jgi:hypothetical protein
MTKSRTVLLLALATLLAGCEIGAATGPQSRDTVDNPGQTPMGP